MRKYECYCCKEIIKEEKECYLVSIKPFEIVEKQLCGKVPFTFEEMWFCSIGCIIVELAKGIKQ